MTIRWHALASPKPFYTLSVKLSGWLWATGLLLLAIALFGGLVLAPPDYLQGNSFRIIYIHVPSAWLSMAAYVSMATASAIGIIWRMRLAFFAARAQAPIGAMFTALALITGAIWGKPTWGTWWVWDARLTSELILLFLFIGYIALFENIADEKRAFYASGFLAIIGVINIPIIHYSVVWWHTLHQGQSIRFIDASSTIHSSMLWPLLVAVIAMTILYVAYTLSAIRNQILLRESQARWLLTAVEAGDVR